MTPLRKTSLWCALLMAGVSAQAGCFHDTHLSSPDANPITGAGGGNGSASDAVAQTISDGGGPRLTIAFSRGAVRGNLGGHIAADEICQNGAESGTWRAWLSDASSNAIDRIKADGPWYTVDGRLAFADRAQLAHTPSAVIQYDQGGLLVAASSYWTGTAVGGQATTSNCNNWTTIADDVTGTWGDGRQAQGPETWTAAGTDTCAEALNLLCIEDLF